MTLDEALIRQSEIAILLQSDINNDDLWAEHYAIAEACKTVRPDKGYPPVKIK